VFADVLRARAEAQEAPVLLPGRRNGEAAPQQAARDSAPLQAASPGGAR
jgi:hypothetical protein